jgi:hypothetical protein
LKYYIFLQFRRSALPRNRLALIHDVQFPSCTYSDATGNLINDKETAIDTKDPTSAEETRKNPRKPFLTKTACLTTESFKTSPFDTSTDSTAANGHSWRHVRPLHPDRNSLWCWDFSLRFQVVGKCPDGSHPRSLPHCFRRHHHLPFVIVDKRTVKGKDTVKKDRERIVANRQAEGIVHFCWPILAFLSLHVVRYNPISDEKPRMTLVGCLCLGPIACFFGYCFHLLERDAVNTTYFRNYVRAEAFHRRHRPWWLV